jgi:plastocyanin
MNTRLLLCSGAACLAMAGCGSSNSGSGSSSSSTPASTPAAAGGAVTINMQNIQFSPKNQTVKVGDKVTWVNEDSVDHDVKAESGANFQSDQFGKGGKYSFTPTKAGEIKYVCTLHPGMEGTLTVK